MFALINMTIQRRFSSGYGLALYENCFRFHRTSSTGWWSLETFRKLMGVDESAYYETYKHLNAKIIKPAVAEVNKYSNIIVTPEVRKRGRAVKDIRFLIAENPQLAILDQSHDMLQILRVWILHQLLGCVTEYNFSVLLTQFWISLISFCIEEGERLHVSDGNGTFQ